jgi:hypothetical protein
MNLQYFLDYTWKWAYESSYEYETIPMTDQTILNPIRKNFVRYDTEKQSQYILQFFIERKKFLHLKNIEKEAGMYDKQLQEFVSGKHKTLDLKTISKLIPILELFGFDVPCFGYTINNIQKMVSHLSQLSIEKLKEKSRKRKIVEERMIAMYFCKQLVKSEITNKPISDRLIGVGFGGFNHATVFKAIETVNNLLETNIKIKEKVNKYQQYITPENKLKF